MPHLWQREIVTQARNKTQLWQQICLLDQFLRRNSFSFLPNPGHLNSSFRHRAALAPLILVSGEDP